jgi:hypothetical protein
VDEIPIRIVREARGIAPKYSISGQAVVDLVSQIAGRCVLVLDAGVLDQAVLGIVAAAVGFLDWFAVLLSNLGRVVLCARHEFRSGNPEILCYGEFSSKAFSRYFPSMTHLGLIALSCNRKSLKFVRSLPKKRRSRSVFSTMVWSTMI